MATALAFLAVHDDVQAEAYDQISSVAGVEETIVCILNISILAFTNFHGQSFDKVNLLDKVTAVFLESVRMFRKSHISSVPSFMAY